MDQLKRTNMALGWLAFNCSEMSYKIQYRATGARFNGREMDLNELSDVLDALKTAAKDAHYQMEQLKIEETKEKPPNTH